MPHYFLANIRIHDPELYEKYLEKVDEVAANYKGHYLAVDHEPVRLEGQWNYTKTVIIEFPSKQDFEDWYFSPGYQEILKYRLNAAVCDSVLLEGLE